MRIPKLPKKPLTIRPRQPVRLAPRPGGKLGCCGRGLSGGKKLIPKK